MKETLGRYGGIHEEDNCQGLEDKGAETGSRVTELGVAKDRTCYGPMGVATPDNSLTGVNRNGKEAAGNMWTQEMGTGIRMRVSMGQRK